jgi:hypothetical protein
MKDKQIISIQMNEVCDINCNVLIVNSYFFPPTMKYSFPCNINVSCYNCHIMWLEALVQEETQVFFLRIEVLGREANIQEQGVIYVLHPFILPLGLCC